MVALSAGVLMKEHTFLKIWSAIFLSAAGTFLLLMTLSARVLENLHSIPHANVVVLTQWIPAIVALPLIKKISSELTGKSVLLVAEIGCLAFTCIAAIFADQYFVLLAVLLARGTCDSLSKVGRATALRQYFSGELLEKAASYYNTALLLGGAVGSAMGLMLYGPLTAAAIAGLCAVLNAAAAIIYWSLPQEAAALPSDSANPKAEIPANPEWVTGRASLYFIACVSLFQGFHNFARTAYPISHLHLAENSIPLVQMLTNASYIAGAVIAAKIALNRKYLKTAAISHILTVGALITLPFIQNQIFGLSIYAVFGLLFEIGFCLHLRFVITNASKKTVGAHIANINAWSMGLMVTVAYGGSLLQSYLGFEMMVALIALVAILTIPLSALLFPKKSVRS